MIKIKYSLKCAKFKISKVNNRALYTIHQILTEAFLD